MSHSKKIMNDVINYKLYLFFSVSDQVKHDVLAQSKMREALLLRKQSTECVARCKTYFSSLCRGSG